MKKKVLIIEDETGLRKNIETLLYEEGYDVKTADNGFSGLELAKSFQPDIIISDIVMKGMNGYEVLQEIIKDDKTKRIPFIFLSARVEREQIRMGMELGADDYLLKPFKGEELLIAIDARLKRSNIFRDANKKAKKEKETKKENYTIDDKVFIKQKNEISFIKIIDIKYIKSLNQYSEVFLNNGRSIVVHKSMNDWEALLPEKNFIRIHREYIVCFDKIVKMENWFHNSYRIFLQDIDFPFEISTRYASKIRMIC